MKKFSLEMEVRENELDAQGIVNNANYMIYLSHARHKHGELIGIDHSDYLNKGLNLVVTSCTMKFKSSLISRDQFSVTSEIVPCNLPFHWTHKQEIIRTRDTKIILRAMFNITCAKKELQKNILCIPKVIDEIICNE